MYDGEWRWKLVQIGPKCGFAIQADQLYFIKSISVPHRDSLVSPEIPDIVLACQSRANDYPRIFTVHWGARQLPFIIEIVGVSSGEVQYPGVVKPAVFVCFLSTYMVLKAACVNFRENNKHQLEAKQLYIWPPIWRPEDLAQTPDACGLCLI